MSLLGCLQLKTEALGHLKKIFFAVMMARNLLLKNKVEITGLQELVPMLVNCVRSASLNNKNLV